MQLGNRLKLLRDLRQLPTDQQYLCDDQEAITARLTGGPFQCWQPIWQGAGLVTVSLISLAYNRSLGSLGGYDSSVWVPIQSLRPILPE